MKRHLGRLIVFLIGLALFLVNVFYQGLPSAARDWFRVLSNAALVPGVLLSGLGLLMRISDDGFFDGIRYSISSMISHLKGTQKKYPSFYEYSQRQRKKSGAFDLLLPGLIFLAVAVGMLLLYNFCSA